MHNDVHTFKVYAMMHKSHASSLQKCEEVANQYICNTDTSISAWITF